MNSKIRAGAIAALAPLFLVAVVACTPTVPLTPAANATDPVCAEVIVRLPSSVADQAIRETNAQATGAWGNPAAVLLRCGVTPPGPTTETCYTVKDIDWLIDDSAKPRYVFTTFGRNPAVQVIIDSKLTNGQGTIVLDELANAIGSIKQTAKCLNREDVLGTSTPTPTPTP
jgi:hypothetical protein